MFRDAYPPFLASEESLRRYVEQNRREMACGPARQRALEEREEIEQLRGGARSSWRRYSHRLFGEALACFCLAVCAVAT
jgi:hypothetical protein